MRAGDRAEEFRKALRRRYLITKKIRIPEISNVKKTVTPER